MPTKIAYLRNSGLGGSEVPAPEQQNRAVAELDKRQRQSAAWQLALGDESSELVSQIDFDLRDRLRDVLESAEKDIKKSDPLGRWKRFDQSVRADVTDAVHANFDLAGVRSQRLAERVAAELGGNSDGSASGVALPSVWVEQPETALALIKPMEQPEVGGLFARVVNSLRGSYGGILMVGVLTSLAGQSATDQPVLGRRRCVAGSFYVLGGPQERARTG